MRKYVIRKGGMYVSDVRHGQIYITALARNAKKFKRSVTATRFTQKHPEHFMGGYVVEEFNEGWET